MTAAVNSYKSTTITHRDATPQVPTPGFVSKGNLVAATAYLTLAALATDSAGSNFVMVTVPSNARINSVTLSCTSSGSTGAVNIGVFQTTANGGAAVGTYGAAFFATAQVLTSALIKQQVAWQTDPAGATGYGLNQVEMPLWQALGLSSDPGCYYDIQIVSSAVLVTASKVALDVTYAV